jgi:GT2 family glycosyltransferase
VRSLCRDPIRYLAVEARGVGYSRRKAVENARCQVIAFTDDDCHVDPGWIGAIRDAFREHPEAAGVTGAIRPDPSSPTSPELPKWVSQWGYKESRVFSEPVEPTRVGGGLNVAFRVPVLQEVGNFDPLLGPGSVLRNAEDIDLVYRVLRAGHSVAYTPAAVVSHHPARDLAEHEHNERTYARGYGAWAAKGWVEGDPLPGRYWRQVLVRNSWYLLRRGPWEGARRMLQRTRISWNLLAGWVHGARVYRAARRQP